MRFIHATTAALVFLGACYGTTEPTPVEPLLGAVEIPVSLVMTSGISKTGLPRLDVSGFSHGVEARWEVVSGPCMLSKAVAKQAGSVIQIEIEQSGNPLANCTPDPIAYRFVTRVTGLSPRQYEVRVIDAQLGVRPVQVGRRSATVLP